jgi:hypothetical protein
MPWVVFQSTIPVFERAKTVHSLDLTATVIGPWAKFLGLKYVVCLLKNEQSEVT